MKFRKKPVVIDAVQWFPGVVIEGVVIEAKLISAPDIRDCVENGVNEKIRECGAIHTMEGWHLVIPGDWVITGVKGEKYPCKPDIFVATYERVTTEE